MEAYIKINKYPKGLHVLIFFFLIIISVITIVISANLIHQFFSSDETYLVAYRTENNTITLKTGKGTLYLYQTDFSSPEIYIQTLNFLRRENNDTTRNGRFNNF
jgi:hypothetical protein